MLLLHVWLHFLAQQATINTAIHRQCQGFLSRTRCYSPGPPQADQALVCVLWLAGCLGSAGSGQLWSYCGYCEAEAVWLSSFTPSKFPPLCSLISFRSPALLVPQPWSMSLLPSVIKLPLWPLRGGRFCSQASSPLLVMANRKLAITFRK